MGNNYKIAAASGYGKAGHPSKKGQVGSFTRWLCEHRKLNTPIGDIARDAYADADWPYGDLENIKRYLTGRVGESSPLWPVLDGAWLSYLAQTPEKDRRS